MDDTDATLDRKVEDSFVLTGLEHDYLIYLARKSLVGKTDIVRKLIREAKIEGLLEFRGWHEESYINEGKSLPDLLPPELPRNEAALANGSTNSLSEPPKVPDLETPPKPLIEQPNPEPIKVGVGTATSQGQSIPTAPAKSTRKKKEPPAEPAKTKSITKTRTARVKAKPPVSPTTETKPAGGKAKSDVSSTTETKLEEVRAKEPGGLNVEKLKREYKDKDFEDVILEILDDDASKTWTLDAIIGEAYEKLESETLQSVKISLGRFLNKGSTNKLWRKIREKPSTFQSVLNAKG